MVVISMQSSLYRFCS